MDKWNLFHGLVAQSDGYKSAVLESIPVLCQILKMRRHLKKSVNTH
jgi:hypothetical protein